MLSSIHPFVIQNYSINCVPFGADGKNNANAKLTFNVVCCAILIFKLLFQKNVDFCSYCVAIYDVDGLRKYPFFAAVCRQDQSVQNQYIYRTLTVQKTGFNGYSIIIRSGKKLN